MEAGMTAGYFNALEKDFPITIASDRAATPILHKLLIRPDLKDQIKKIADLKGRTVAVNGTASVVNYELGKLLETVGLTIKDVELKVLPFPQMGVGLANKAVDAAVAIPPWVFQLVDQNIGAVLVDVDDHVKPTPLSIAVAFINTDWARQNREVAHNFFVAYIRGVREYCQAYHNGPNRQEVIDIAVRTGVERRQELLYKYPWPSRDPNGRFNMASLLDIQSWYVKAGLTQKQFAPERIATNEYVDYACRSSARSRSRTRTARFQAAAETPTRGRNSMAVERRGAAIEIVGLRKEYVSGPGRVLALDNIDLRISPGEFVCIVGPSGCGKSTLLRILAGLDTQTGGTLKIEAPGWPVQNAMVFQESGLFPWMSVETNVAFGLMTRGVPAAEAAERVEAALKLVGLTKFRRHYPHQLSGGMRQRSAIARAFVTDPGVLLMDEPFAALDAQNRVILQAELVRIWEHTRKTVVYITHSIDEALLLGDRTVVMTAQPGRIKQIIDVPFPHPRNLITLSSAPEFGKLKLDIWGVLEDEVMRARAEEEG